MSEPKGELVVVIRDRCRRVDRLRNRGDVLGFHVLWPPEGEYSASAGMASAVLSFASPDRLM